MPLINWSDNLSVSVKELDRQHQQLISTINDLHTAMLERKSNDILGTILRKLIQYTVDHFQYEENIMTKTGYPGYDAQQSEHKKFVDKVNMFSKEFEDGNQLISIDILMFLSDWINGHIMGSDKKYASHFNEHNIF